ncbi:hypothetical protein MHZ95_17550 [Sporosarcina sp. ACRSM]|uniref:hypothetical protein n=1 Tax=Sporosarcina sp. ACRSM TaxID=2918216 RepID=UPI001EF4DC06|nr:hypothetical protein [Sporosarcina sp. ACRSM]MCG7337068.1 hypothetical protein [Sporosarcina sp. ACRSM]
MKRSKTTDLIICFDESGKQSSDPIQLMGALCVPSSIYYHSDFNPLHQLNQEYEFHWTEYGGYSKTRIGIEKLFDLALPLAPYTQMNFINYSKSALELQAGVFSDIYDSKQTIASDTIYTKLPERICYGLLRGYGEHNQVQAKILVEDATEYRSKDLANRMQHALNIHSLYRGESFIINEFDYRAKGEEVGVEMVDLLLGMVGLILNNPINPGRKRKAKITLTLKLLKCNKLQPFLKNLRLFQLKNSNRLIEMNIEASVKLFIARNYGEFLSL